MTTTQIFGVGFDELTMLSQAPEPPPDKGGGGKKKKGKKAKKKVAKPK